MTPQEQQVGSSTFIEAIRAQRTEALDASAKWFAQMMVEKTRADRLEIELAKLKEGKPE